MPGPNHISTALNNTNTNALNTANNCNPRRDGLSVTSNHRNNEMVSIVETNSNDFIDRSADFTQVSHTFDLLF